MNFRVGIGYDIHRLIKGRKLILGGAEIPYKLGLLAHSDGDVLIHSVCDALLGAAGLGDIGEHFSDRDKKYKNISSSELLKNVYGKLRKENFKIGNIDCSLIADNPKIEPYRAKIKINLAGILKIKKELVNLKATTSEGVGRIGADGIACYSIALIYKEGEK